MGLGDIPQTAPVGPGGGGLSTYLSPADQAAIADMQAQAAAPAVPTFVPQAAAAPASTPVNITPADRAALQKMVTGASAPAPGTFAQAVTPADQAVARSIGVPGGPPAVANRPDTPPQVLQAAPQTGAPTMAPGGSYVPAVPQPQTYPEKVRAAMKDADIAKLSRAADDLKVSERAALESPPAIGAPVTKKEEKASADVAKDAATGKVPDKKTVAEATKAVEKAAPVEVAAVVAPAAAPPTPVQITQAAVPAFAGPLEGKTVSPDEAAVLGQTAGGAIGAGGPSYAVPKPTYAQIAAGIENNSSMQNNPGTAPTPAETEPYQFDRSLPPPPAVPEAPPFATREPVSFERTNPPNASVQPAAPPNASTPQAAAKPAPAKPPPENQVYKDMVRQAELVAPQGDAEIEANKVAAKNAEDFSNLRERLRLEDEAKNAESQAREQDFIRRNDENSKATAAYQQDPNRYMHNQSFLQKGLLVLASTLSQASMAVNHQSGLNPVLEQYNREVSRDIDAQKMDYEKMRDRGKDIQNQYSMNMKVDQNEQAARAASHAQALNAFADHADAQAIATKNPAVIARVAQETNKMRTLADVYKQNRDDALLAAQAKAGAGGNGLEDKILLKLMDSTSKEAGDPYGLAGKSPADLRVIAKSIASGQGGEGFTLAPHEKPGATKLDPTEKAVQESEAKARQTAADFKALQDSLGGHGPRTPEEVAKYNALRQAAIDAHAAAASRRGTPQEVIVEQGPTLFGPAASRLGFIPLVNSDYSGSNRAATQATADEAQRATGALPSRQNL